MAEKEYIEREALLERIDGIRDCNDMVFRPNDHCCKVPEDCKGCKWAETRDAIRRIVENDPAADVVDKHDICDMVRERMTAMINPMSKEAEEATQGQYYRRWIELWWWLDHYCEKEPPKWGDEND